MILIELTPDDVLNLRNLLDAAVRAGGMRAAEFAIPIDAKILAAARAWEAQQAKLGGNGGLSDRPTL
jgi:hypothetical protein